MKTILSRAIIMVAAGLLMAQAAPAPKTTLAVYPIQAVGEVKASLAVTLTSLLNDELKRSPVLSVVDEGTVRAAIAQKAPPGQDQCDTTACRVEVGKQVQAQKLVAGKLSQLGALYILTLSVLDVASGNEVFSAADKCACVEDKLDQLVASTSAPIRAHLGESVPGVQTPPAGTAPSQEKSADDYLLDGAKAYQDKDYDLAVKLFSRGLELDPKNVYLWFCRGGSYRAKGDYAQAIEDFSRVVDLDPKFFLSIYEFRGNTYLLNKDYQHAIRDFTKALELNPQNADLAATLAWLYATCPDAQYRSGKKAVELATKACELTKWVEASNLDVLAAAYAQSGNFIQAILAEQKAIPLAKNKEAMAAYEARLKQYQRGKPYREQK